MTLEMKTEYCKITCNKKTSKKSNDVIEENNIGKINDIVEHVLFEKEVEDLFDDSSTSSDNTEDEESLVNAIDDDNVEELPMIVSLIITKNCILTTKLNVLKHNYQIDKNNKEQEINNEIAKIFNNNLHISYKYITIFNLHIKKIILSLNFFDISSFSCSDFISTK